MTSRKLMTLALATVLTLNCSGLRAADVNTQAPDDATLAKLATELAQAEQKAPAMPSPVSESVPTPVESVAPAAASVSDVAPSVPEMPAPTDATN